MKRWHYLIEVVDLLDALLQPLPAAARDHCRLGGHLRRVLLGLPRRLPEAVVGEGRPLVRRGRRGGLVVQRQRVVRELLLLGGRLPEPIGDGVLDRPLLGLTTVLVRPVQERK